MSEDYWMSDIDWSGEKPSAQPMMLISEADYDSLQNEVAHWKRELEAAQTVSRLLRDRLNRVGDKLRRVRAVLDNCDS